MVDNNDKRVMGLPEAGAAAFKGDSAQRRTPAGGAGLDPRRARMVREVADFGFEWRVGLEIGRLVAAAAFGAIVTYAFSGHGPSRADAVGGADIRAVAVQPGPKEASRKGADVAVPELLAPLQAGPVAAPESPQRDVHSDGGGHCARPSDCGQ